MEICPSCGSFADKLNELTGWCIECSPPCCQRCGGELIKGTLCQKCAKEQWLAFFADEIEYFLSEGFSYSQAIQEIYNRNRAVCVVCAAPIPGRSQATTLFCAKNEGCRKARRRYHKLVYEKGMTRSLALEQVLVEQVLGELREAV